MYESPTTTCSRTLTPLSIIDSPPTLRRSYPRQRGSQVESEYNSLRSSLRRAYTAAAEILKRIATLKTQGKKPQPAKPKRP